VSSALFDPFSGPLGNPIAFNAAMDASLAFGIIDAYRGRPPHVATVRSDVHIRRGEQLAFLHRVKAPRRVKPGRMATLRVTMQRLRGGNFTRRYRVRIPRDVKPGRRMLRLSGLREESEEDELLELILGIEEEDEEAPRPARLDDLIKAIRGLAVWDGVELRMGRLEERAFRDSDLVITGRTQTPVRVVGKKRRR
jgi:hypothetical protein